MVHIIKVEVFLELSFCTDSFSIQDVVRLMNVLIIRYDLKCTLHRSNENYRIYISSSGIKILQEKQQKQLNHILFLVYNIKQVQYNVLLFNSSSLLASASDKPAFANKFPAKAKAKAKAKAGLLKVACAPPKYKDISLFYSASKRIIKINN